MEGMFLLATWVVCGLAYVQMESKDPFEIEADLHGRVKRIPDEDGLLLDDYMSLHLHGSKEDAEKMGAFPPQPGVDGDEMSMAWHDLAHDHEEAWKSPQDPVEVSNWGNLVNKNVDRNAFYFNEHGAYDHARSNPIKVANVVSHADGYWGEDSDLQVGLKDVDQDGDLEVAESEYVGSDWLDQSTLPRDVERLLLNRDTEAVAPRVAVSPNDNEMNDATFEAEETDLHLNEADEHGDEVHGGGLPDDAEGSDSEPEEEAMTQVPQPSVTCEKSRLLIQFSLQRHARIFLQKDRMRPLPVLELPRSCKHTVRQSNSSLVLMASFDGCYVRNLRKDNRLHEALTLKYYDLILKRPFVTTVSCPVTTAPMPEPPKGLSISCSDVCMTVQLPAGPLSAVQILDSSKTLVPVLQAPKLCGYALVKKDGKNLLTIPYTACDVKMVEKRYIIQVAYVTSGGERAEIQVSCPYTPLVPKQGCLIPKSQQVSCGPKSSKACLAKGCCVDSDTAHCYYPLEECTADKHFVFVVHRTITVNPASLVIAGNKSCTPVICTADFAVFKFPVTGCGTHAFVVGETTIYLAEVMALVRRNSLNYGVITRDSPFRLLVECRYAEGNLASTGYLVKNPYLPNAILSHGVFGVQLRIATDDAYSRFYPPYHRPLRLLLGRPVFLEVQLLNAPDPSLVLLVHYCVAYPRSAQAVWVLVYDGCPNPLDYGHTSTLHIHHKQPLPKHHRRFEIRTFQFMDHVTHRYLNEEIYFMCSTEVCSPSAKTCVEGCFDGRKIPVVEDPNADKRCTGEPCPGKAKSSAGLPAQ
ncbi:zona pellucida sperm-binding protein 4-like [Amia ocellicauda]|uniref:zona pellucida sperm-binding protein 4-like n=1 Tax=Amia ocellicauda TaxID=2972642 RepID=UPI0034641A64